MADQLYVPFEQAVQNTLSIDQRDIVRETFTRGDQRNMVEAFCYSQGGGVGHFSVILVYDDRTAGRLPHTLCQLLGHIKQAGN
tara:strand:+ start:239 stop:487 length:249 start_codon:yes stop_codon:yes gene_type:complete